MVRSGIRKPSEAIVWYIWVISKGDTRHKRPATKTGKEADHPGYLSEPVHRRPYPDQPSFLSVPSPDSENAAESPALAAYRDFSIVF